MKTSLAILPVLFLAACASSPYKYYVEPTPLEANKTKYELRNLEVNLRLGDGAKPGDESFATQAQLRDEFEKSLRNHMKSKNILATDNSDNIHVDVSIDYLRRFNIGGGSLNKPELAHTVTISRDGEKLASFSQSGYTTKYGYLDDAAVNFEIAAFSWDAEDEPKDVELVSEIIVKDLAKVGS
ncbi:MAG: hypothetical protein CME36_06700 [unclassified Hahellaceae]|nr:hypothetical protein [Hahellaceae bacterium]|tara:strand:- start:19043 stop:19591 length:549 start_codon:yes stop_codon:yes gene_type:complete